jgi:nucleotide-binding universal stress UspA family protein
MYANVTIPVDPYASDWAGASVAGSIAQRLGAPLELVTVASEHDASDAQSALESFASRIESATTCRVLIADRVGDALLGDALSRADTLWCVQTHAKTAVVEAVVGSVSEELARDVGLPVVLIGPNVEQRSFDGGVILVTVDGTMISEEILPVATDLARALRLGMRVVHVIDSTEVPDGHIAEESGYVRRLAKEWSGNGLDWDFDVLHGKHAESAVADYVESHGEVVLVAAATNGVPADARVAYPSTVFRMVRKAACPVVVLHPRPAEVTDADRPRVVVVGVDTTVASRDVLNFAAAEAARRSATLLLAHAWDEPAHSRGDAGPPYVPASLHAVEEIHLARADEAAEFVKAAHPDLVVQAVITRGRPAELLIECSRQAEVVVVGHHTHGRVSTALLGSTARLVTRRAWCGVIVVPSDQPIGNEMKTIIVATDGSAIADVAAAWAYDECVRSGAELTMLHVWNYPYVGQRTGVAEPRDLTALDAARELEGTIVRLRAVKGDEVAIHPRLIEGAIGETLRNEAAAADLLVVGSHGRSAVGRVLMGSVSSSLIDDAPCPVAVVRAPFVTVP